MAVSHHPALWSPDFLAPARPKAARPRPLTCFATRILALRAAGRMGPGSCDGAVAYASFQPIVSPHAQRHDGCIAREDLARQFPRPRRSVTVSMLRGSP